MPIGGTAVVGGPSEYTQPAKTSIAVKMLIVRINLFIFLPPDCLIMWIYIFLLAVDKRATGDGRPYGLWLLGENPVYYVI
jgi:hypothetical protein